MRFVCWAIVMMGLVAAPLAAQETPEAVVQRYFETFRDGQFAENAAMMDPAALTSLHGTMVEMARATGVDSTETRAHLREMFGVENLEQLRALAPEAVYERMLRSVLGQGEMKEILAGAQVNVLGHVLEGDTAHVVYRMKMSVVGTSIDQVQVAPVRRVDGRWRVLLTGSFAGLINSMPAAGIQEHE